jgi:hypothetical protein
MREIKMLKYKKINLFLLIIIFLIFIPFSMSNIIKFNHSGIELSNLIFEWHKENQLEYNVTYIDMPAGYCALNSQINITGNESYADEKYINVVMISDLSNSMDDCISPLNYTRDADLDNCYSFFDSFDTGLSNTHENKIRKKWWFYGGWDTKFDGNYRDSRVLYNTDTNSNLYARYAEIKDIKFKNYNMSFLFRFDDIDLDNSRFMAVTSGKKIERFYRNNHPITGDFTVRFYGNNKTIRLYYGNKLIFENDTFNITNDYFEYNILINNSYVFVSVNNTIYIDNTFPVQYTTNGGYMGFVLNNLYGYLDNVHVISLDHDYNCTTDLGYASLYDVFPSYLYDDIYYEGDAVCNNHINNRSATSCDGHYSCTGPFYTNYGYVMCDGPSKHPCCDEANPLISCCNTDPYPSCYYYTDYSTNQFSNSCTYEDFLNYNFSRCSIRGLGHYWTNNLYLFSPGNCNDNSKFTHNCNSFGGTWCNSENINTTLGRICQDFSFTLNYDVPFNKTLNILIINETFEGLGNIPNWLRADWTNYNMDYQQNYLDQGILRMWDNNGRRGHININVRNIFIDQNNFNAIEVYTPFLGNLSFDYRCQEGARIGLLFYFNSLDWRISRYGSIASNHNFIGSEFDQNTNSYNQALGSVALLSNSTQFICDDIWRKININISELNLGERRLENILIGDWDDTNSSNTNKNIFLDNFTLNYNIPQNHFFDECGINESFIIPDIDTSVILPDYYIPICYNDGNPKYCPNDSTRKRCYIRVEKTDTECDVSTYNQTIFSECRTTTSGGEGESIIWNRRFIIEHTDNQFYREIISPRYEWQWGYQAIHNRSRYFTHCSDIGGIVDYKVNYSKISYDFNLLNDINRFNYFYYPNSLSYWRNTRFDCDYCTRFYWAEFYLQNNLAINANINSDCGLSSSVLNRINNNNYNANNECTCSHSNRHITLDLGSNYNISRVKVWTRSSNSNSIYTNGFREYSYTLLLSNDPTFSSSTTIWDYSSDGYVVESFNGNEIILNTPTNARYLRLITNDYKDNFQTYPGIHLNQIAVYTNLTLDDVSENIDFRNIQDDGARCFINGKEVHYITDVYSSYKSYPVSKHILNEGKNLLTCQVKEATGNEYFNIRLYDGNNIFLNYGEGYNFIQQRELCGTGGDPKTSGRCEFAKPIDNCEDKYPYNISKTENLTISAWTINNNELNFLFGFSPLVNYFTSKLGGKIDILGQSTTNNNINQIDNNIWNSDVVIIDRNDRNVASHHDYYSVMFNRMAIDNKTIITGHHHLGSLNTFFELTKTTDSYSFSSSNYNLYPTPYFKDLSGNNHHAFSLINLSTNNGKFGKGVEFNGINNFISVPYLGISGSQERTISAWIKSNNLIQNSWTNVFGFAGGSGSNQFFDIQVNQGICSNRGYVLHLYSNQWCIKNEIDLDWHFITATYNGSIIKVYFDGILVLNQSFSSLSTIDNFNIGKRNDNNNYWNGLVDEVKVWKKALNESEIIELYNTNTFLNYENDLVLDLSFEDYFIPIYTPDSSGNNNHAVPFSNIGNIISSDGVINNSFYFNGVNNYLDLGYGNKINPSSNPHSFSLWVKPNDLSSNTIFMSSGQTGGSNNRFYIGINNGMWDMGIRNTQWDAGTISAELNWTHITVVMDGTQARMYANNQLTRTINYASYSFNRNIYLATHDNNYWFNGNIDDVRIWNRVLTEEEILNLHNLNSFPAENNNLVLHLKLDDLIIKNKSTLITDRTYTTLSSSWYGIRERSSSFDGQIFERSANFLNSIYPLWYSGDVSNSHEIPDEYCIQGNTQFEICSADRMKLLKHNTYNFFTKTVDHYDDGVQLGLVAYGSDSNNCYQHISLTSNSNELRNEVSRYDADCGATCISCAIKDAIDILLPELHDQSIEHNIFLMSDGLANRVIGNPTSENVAGAKAEVWHYACNDSYAFSAKRLGIKIHSVFYGSNITQYEIDAIDLMREVANCTDGIFGHGDNIEDLSDLYDDIIDNLGKPFPKPEIKIGNHEFRFDWQYNLSRILKDSILWRNWSSIPDDAFALQNILSDLFSSFSIYFDKPFVEGDFIIIGNDMGIVKKIGIKSTRIQTLQGQELVVSNKELTSTRINNYKKMSKRRAIFNFGVEYSTSKKKLEKIPTIVKKIINNIELASLDRAHFKSFGDSSLDFEVVYYVDSSDYAKYMDIQQEINLALVLAFEKEKINFAFPSRTIYMAK